MMRFRMFFRFFVLCVLMAIYAQPLCAQSYAVGDEINDFAVQMYAELSNEKPTDNLLFSPYSIYSALSMAYAGTTEDTKAEFERILNIAPEQDSLVFHKKLQTLNTMLKPSNDSYKFETANAIWVKPDFPIEQNYVKMVKRYYGAEARNELSVDVINAWVANKTHDKITDLLQPGSVDESTVTVLTNTAYFLGAWKDQFDKLTTMNRPFYGFEKTSNVPLMYQKEHFGYYEDGVYQSVKMEYKGSALAMAVVLPKEKSAEAFSALESKLLEDGFIGDLIQNYRSKEVNLFLPRFKAKIPSGLKTPLIHMGLKQATTSTATFCALYSGCKEKPVYIGDVVHQAYIKVDEQGTEAAAATAVIMTFKSALPVSKPKEFRADHPFIYFIYHKQSGAILFMGRMVMP